MSLLKQVSIVLGFIFLILFVSIIGLSFNIIKDSSAKSLYENVQNSVTSTSLSITNAGVDEGTIKTVINAAFDNGNYEKIVFKNINDEIVYELKKELIISDEIPHWFIKIEDTGEISALASISEGWNVLGVLEIYADRAIYYNQTYSMFIKLLQSLAFSFVVLIIILSIFFNFILKPLRTINNQAKAVMNNEFILSTEQPFTDEFKTLTTSINSMVSKFEKMFQNTNEVLKTNKELLYFDEVTKINNRKYFILKANEYLDKDSSNNKGFIVSLSIKLDAINKTYGFIKTNIICNFNLFKTGLLMLFLTIPLTLVSNLAGRLYYFIGAKTLISCGYFLMILCSVLGLFFQTHSSLILIILANLSFGLAWGLVMVPAATTAMQSLDHDNAGAGAGSFNTLQEIGGVVGLTIIVTIVRLHSDFITGLHQGFMTLLFFSLMGLSFGLGIKKS